ncbi:hypothetical protein Metev_0622 [Methanohalobium evestigatum Z-7303]|uniref:Uncharacterized protein n=1 Tax=Methanohalobium evestigatum (strain ATCC BAA-1072 / DSM 3721 / NBRC 107634 / OCM 161 / Z-7303) TaxID=644295 RepID=D7E8I6_METEZ|nr:hypothetical protein [Methanohalobium evestigatum]ADI73528.1 hypothetical protein Metev_0622 [Methanohalobium evestigatum Z-7303]
MINAKSIITLIILLAAAVSLSGCLDLSTTGISEPMPVRSVDYTEDNPGNIDNNYWRISTTVDGTGEEYVLEVDEEQLKDGDTQAQNSLRLYFRPTQPYWDANCYEPSNKLQYAYWNKNLWGTFKDLRTEDAKYWRVSGVDQTIHAGYEAVIEADGEEVASGTVTNFATDDTESGTLTMEAEGPDGRDHTIYITLNNLEMKGVLTPKGELAIVSDGTDANSDSSYDLVNYITLKETLEEEREFAKTGYDNLDPTQEDPDIWNWQDAYDWMRNNGLRSEIPSQSVSGYDIRGVESFSSNPQGIEVYYSKGTFSTSVTAYIPEELADTIVEEKAAPSPDINKLDSVTTVEGESVNFKVTVDNKGTGGDVELTAVSDALKNIGTIGDQKRYIPSGESESFMFTADVADDITDYGEESFDVKVQADGGVSGQFGTTDTQTFELVVKSSDTAQKGTLKINAVYESTGEEFENAPIYVGYGSDARKGTGSAEVEVMGDIEYAVYSNDTSGYKSQYTQEEPYLVTVEPGGMEEVTIKFAEDRPGSDDEEWGWLWYYIGILAGILLIGFVVWYSGLIEYLIQNPILIAALIIATVVIWSILTVQDMLQSAADAITFWS